MKRVSISAIILVAIIIITIFYTSKIDEKISTAIIIVSLILLLAIIYLNINLKRYSVPDTLPHTRYTYYSR